MSGHRPSKKCVAFRHRLLKVPKKNLVAQYNVRALYLGTGTELEFHCEFLNLEKRFVHISAQRERCNKHRHKRGA